MPRRPPRPTLFPTRRSSDLAHARAVGRRSEDLGAAAAVDLGRVRARAALVEVGVVTGVPDHAVVARSEEHTSELQSRLHLVCRLLLEKKKYKCYAKRPASMN